VRRHLLLFIGKMLVVGLQAHAGTLLFLPRAVAAAAAAACCQV
jgi:hypothetical protein